MVSPLARISSQQPTMAPRIFFSSSFIYRRPNFYFFISTCLAFTTCVFILFHISCTSKLLEIYPIQTHLHVKPPVQFSSIASPIQTNSTTVLIKISNEHDDQNLNFWSLGSLEPADQVGESTSQIPVNGSESRGGLQEANNTSLQEPSSTVETSSLSANDEDEAPKSQNQVPEEILQQGNEGKHIFFSGSFRLVNELSVSILLLFLVFLSCLFCVGSFCLPCFSYCYF